MKVQGVEFQYSAAYSVPWSPLHSSVNSFTMSFTLLLFTRSLHKRGDNKEDKYKQFYTTGVAGEWSLNMTVCSQYVVSK